MSAGTDSKLVREGKSCSFGSLGLCQESITSNSWLLQAYKNPWRKKILFTENCLKAMKTIFFFNLDTLILIFGLSSDWERSICTWRLWLGPPQRPAFTDWTLEWFIWPALRDVIKNTNTHKQSDLLSRWPELVVPLCVFSGWLGNFMLRTYQPCDCVDGLLGTGF